MVIPVFPFHRKACLSAFFAADKIRVSEVHAPRPLAEVSPDGPHISDLGCTDLPRRLGQDTELLIDHLGCPQIVQGDGTSYLYA